MSDATTALIRAIRMNFVNFTLAVEEVRSRSWASATFAGARHELGFRVTGSGALAASESFASGLDAREFALRGHILAEIVLIALEPLDDGARIRIEALTVEDCLAA